VLEENASGEDGCVAGLGLVDEARAGGTGLAAGVLAAGVVVVLASAASDSIGAFGFVDLVELEIEGRDLGNAVGDELERLFGAAGHGIAVVEVHVSKGLGGAFLGGRLEVPGGVAEMAPHSDVSRGDGDKRAASFRPPAAS
jgi:hypothetical protein